MKREATTRESLGLKETETMCEKCTHEEICRREQCGEPYCVIRSCFDFEAKRPHGEWIPFEWDDHYTTKIPLPKGSDSHMEEYWAEEFMCSICGGAHHERDFCPHCGADMREGGDS